MRNQPVDLYETQNKARKATARLSLLARNRGRRGRSHTHVDAIVDRVGTADVPFVGELSRFPIKNVLLVKFDLPR